MSKKIFRWFFSAVAAATIATSQLAFAGSVTMQWNTNPETDITGYRIYYGLFPATYIQQIDVGNTTTHTIDNLLDGVTYYFVITAMNTSHLESAFSNEVSTTIGANPSPTPIPTASPNSILLIPNTITFIDPTLGPPYPAPQQIQVITSTRQPWASQDNSPWFNTAPTNQGASGESCVLSPPGNQYPTTPGVYPETITFSSQGIPNKTATIYLILATPPTPTPSPVPITITGHVHYCETNSGLQGVTITITGSVNLITTTDSNGNYNFQAPSGSTFLATASKADLSPGNFLVSTIDLVALINSFLTNTVLICPRSGDVNNDGKANTIDAIPIQRFILGTYSPPVGRYIFTPIIPLTTDFNALVIGDVK